MKDVGEMNGRQQLTSVITQRSLPHTECDDFQLTDCHVVRYRKLNDEVSERRYVVRTIQRDSRCSRYSAWILTTQSVFPQGRC